MKKSKLWATLQALSLAVLIDCTKGVRLADCSGDNDAVELRENTSGGPTVCEDIAQDQQIEWGLEINGAVTVYARCNSPNQSCQNTTPVITATRISTSSTLTFVSNATRPGAGNPWSAFDVVCRPAGGSGVTCPIDIIYPPSSSEVSCSVSTTRWNIAVSCDVRKAYSARNRYNCDVRLGSSTDSKGSSSYSSGSSSDYVSGNCTSTFPMSTSPGTYTYTVIVYPGVRTVSASPTVTVALPSADPVVNCNDQNSYIPENTPLTCNCTASDLGQPQGHLVVYRDNAQHVSGNNGESSVQFGENSVSRADNNTVYRCVLDWATPDRKDRDTTFTLKVAYGPSSADLTNPPVHELDPTQSSTQLTLTCTAVGVNPSATYIWSGSQCAGTTQSTCSITPIKDDDGAVISCTAINSISNVRKTSQERTLIIHYPPTKKPRIDYSGEPLYEGDTANITCSVNGGNPPVTSVTFGCGGLSQTGSGVRQTVSVAVASGMNGQTCVCSANWENKAPAWYTLNATVTLLVYFPVSFVQLTLNSQTGILQVQENDTADVAFQCVATATPPASLLLSDDQGRELARFLGSTSDVTAGQSVLAYTMRKVRCENSAIYTCTADNGVGKTASSTVTLRVLCDLRILSNSFTSQVDGVPALDASEGQGELRFQIMTTETVRTVSFLYLGSDSTGVGYPPTLGLLSVTCEKTSVTYRSTCVLTAANVTLNQDGYYSVTMATGSDSVSFTFLLQTREFTDSTPATDDDGLSFGVGVGVGLAISAMVLILIGVVTGLCMWRRQLRQSCVERSSHQSMEERPRSVETSLEMTHDTSVDASDTGPYEELKHSDIGLRSVYTDLHTAPVRSSHPAETEGGYEIPVLPSSSL